MGIDLGLLLATAASIGVIHTLLGPDHYVPFVALSASRRWTTRRTLWITSVCGIGHVLGSIAIGAIGIAIGASLPRIEWLEGMRGDAAAWLLTGLGLAYLVWGLKRAWRSRSHSHGHMHADGTAHSHTHDHVATAHVHPHGADRRIASFTPWALFIVFVLGPCEALIPVLMYPASQHSVWGTLAVVLVFAAATIATMLGTVYLGLRGLRFLPMDAAARYSHALAGAALSLCGFGILVLGL